MIALTGTVTVDESGATLDRFDAAVLSEGDAATVHVDGAAAVVTVTPA